MAEPTYLYLTFPVEGTEVQGESSEDDMGGVEVRDAIECHSFNWGVYNESEGGHVQGGSSVRRVLPFSIRKEIDKSTPLLMKACCEGITVEATFKQFRENEAPQSGGVEHFMHFECRRGVISSVSHFMNAAGGGFVQPYEVVEFAFDEIDNEAHTNTSRGASENTVAAYKWSDLDVA